MSPKNIDLSDPKISTDFDPLELRSNLIKKFELEWKDVERIRNLIVSLDIGSYQLAGNQNDPVITSYTLSS